MDVTPLQRLLDSGRDSALLRLSLGKALLDAGEPGLARPHLQRCIELDSAYSAGWKLLGKACLADGEAAAAAQAWQRGIAVAHGNGDQQAGKEMTVFLRRALKALPPPG
ncbi:hypothetical protein [Stenotrophomonas sp.]|uniref:tetratricopeptide repeat protein n=1 Tax=Stenotrophomonas sp. TaxID=69392 RepID=UPI002FC8539E